MKINFSFRATRWLEAIGLLIFFQSSENYAQTIPYGFSADTLVIFYPCTLSDGSPCRDTFTIAYYKPTTYDSLTSPILFNAPESGWNGFISASMLQSTGIPDRRKALIVAPDNLSTFGYSSIVYDNTPSWDYYCDISEWYPGIVKQMYRHVLARENRDSMDMYITGHSAGGQFTTRYMLIRQAVPDSIPVKMAVSVSPCCYTFCTDTLYGAERSYPDGLADSVTIQECWDNNIGEYTIRQSIAIKDFICEEHVKQYYNENYGVTCGTADSSRIGVARDFYNFSDTDAVNRGTMLQWQYKEIPDVAHSSLGMYSAKTDTSDTTTILERMLFETPYHTVPNLAPLANFSSDTTVVQLPNATVNFINNSINTTNYLWDFGDSTTSTATNPSHTYTTPDTFTVWLKAYSGSGCENVVEKKNYIIVKQGMGMNDMRMSGYFQLIPNPSSSNCNLYLQFTEASEVEINLYNYLGQQIKQLFSNKVEKDRKYSILIEAENLNSGIFYITMKSNNGERQIKKWVLIK